MTQQRGWIRRLLPWLRPHRRKVILAFGAAMLGSGVTAAVPAIEREDLIDHASSSTTTLRWRPGSSPAQWRRGRHPGRLLHPPLRSVAGSVSTSNDYDLRNAIYDQLQKRLDFARHDEASRPASWCRGPTSDVGLQYKGCWPSCRS